MDKGFESWFQGQQINPNLSRAPSFRHRLNIPSFSLGSMLSPDGNAPEFAFSASKPEEPCGWFHGLTPVINSFPKGQVPEPGQKKFLVFDQSYDRTTLIYSSIPIPYQLPEPQFTFNLKKGDSVVEKHKDTHLSNSFHEDTEELKALLYSDDDDDDDDGIDDSEDEEEQSTGHSPEMGFNSRHEWAEEVASSVGCMKRRKLDSGGYDVVSLEDTASSGVEAELSSCGNYGGDGNSVPDVESETFVPAGKRSRKEKVRETISVLQNLIPGGKKGKDAMLILDEAINYLRILKVKAIALGLDSL